MSTQIDINDNAQILQISVKSVDTAYAYAETRKKASDAKFALDTILATKMHDFRKIRTNIGYETSMVMLLEEDCVNARPEIRDYYETYTKQTANYRGLEKIGEALQGQLSLIQSLIKNQIKNT